MVHYNSDGTVTTAVNDYGGNTVYTVEGLNMYYVNYFTHDSIKCIYTNHAGYIFAESEDKIKEHLLEAHACNYKYGTMCLKDDSPFTGRACDCQCKNYISVGIRSIRKVDVKDGMILFGERWREIG